MKQKSKKFIIITVLALVMLWSLCVIPVHASDFADAPEENRVVFFITGQKNLSDIESEEEEVTVSEPVPATTEAAAEMVIAETILAEDDDGALMITVLVPDVIVTEEIPEVPLYFQTDYPNSPYGVWGSVASHGCGITSVSMVFSYLLDYEIMPDTLAAEFGRYNSEHGSYHTLFPDSAEAYGLKVEKTYDFEEAVQALKDGHVLIANPSASSIFTDGGHFIVLYGITDDERILVHDPNKYNYTNGTSVLRDGFANGFDQKYIRWCGPFWIYQLKDI